MRACVRACVRAHSEAAMNALDGASVEGAHDGDRGSGSSHIYCYYSQYTVITMYALKIKILYCISGSMENLEHPWNMDQMLEMVLLGTVH